MTFTELQLQTWLATFFWPFLRIGAMVTAAPLFNSSQIPKRWRLYLALILTFVIAPTIDKVPVMDALSFATFLVVVQQILIGLAMGFVLQMAFAGMVFGGQIIANKMGLGFAQMVDPQNGVQVPVLSQFYLILSTFVFLFLDGHLILIEVLARSFQTMPIGESLGRADYHSIVAWGSDMFTGGLLIALPAVTALLLINLGFGVITRAAPQLHIFAVGFPLAIILGFMLVWASLQGAMDGFADMTESAFRLVKDLVSVI